MFSNSVGERNIQTVLLSFFFSFYFLNALQSDDNSLQLILLGINIFLAFLRAHFSSRLTARAKMNLSQAQNIFMLANINSIVLFARGSQQIRLAVMSAWTKSRPPVL